MFSHDGPSKSAQKNWLLAGYLAAIAGFVNSAGWVLLGSFTSHVTGSIGRAAAEATRSNFGEAGGAALLILCFALGAFAATTVLEASLFGTRQSAYAVAFLLEATLLTAFMALAHSSSNEIQAVILCFAMGLQNSLVTLVSKARVRTTHMSGVVTDLGIELSRWTRWGLRHWRGAAAGDRPAPANVGLLITLVLAFSSGAILGALLAVRLGSRAIGFPAVATLAASLFAFRTGRRKSVA